MSLLRTIRNIALVALFATYVSSHSWIEEMQVISPNGTYIGDRGYTRGYVARTDPTFNGDANILWMLPALDARNPNGAVRNRINSSDLLCHPNQRTANYSTQYPKLKVAPGNFIAMKYLENGHITLPWNIQGKPPAGGTAFVYGTSKPSSTEKIADVLRWTSDGKGGDGRGFLITANNFDDGRGHQINNCMLSAERQVLFPNKIPDQPTSPGQEQWAETDVQIPSSQTAGSTLTIYWIWQWPTESGADCIYPDGKDEYYTSCADFDIVADSVGNQRVAQQVATNTLPQENFQTTAVATFASRTAYTTSPPYMLDDWSTTIGATVTPNASFLTACAASLSAEAGHSQGPPPSCPPGKWATGDLFASVSSRVLAEAQVTPSMLAAGSSVSQVSLSVPATSTTSTPAAESNVSSVSPAAQPTASPPGPVTVTATTTATTTLTTTGLTTATSPSTLLTSAIGTAVTSSTGSIYGNTPDMSSGPANAISTIMTVSASSPSASVDQTPSSFLSTSSLGGEQSATSPSTAVQAPHVGSNNLVQDVAVTGKSEIAVEHVARHANRRHARHFF